MIERVLRYAPKKVGRIVNACVVLHNMCIAGNVVLDDQDDFLDYEVVPDPNKMVNADQDLQEGQRKRREIIDLYFR